MDEIDAIKVINDALENLPQDVQARVLRWAADRFGVVVASKKESRMVGAGPGEIASDDSSDEDKEFSSLADLFVATKPGTDREKALVAAYWHQALGDKPDFTSLEINKDLKDLGHGVGSINKAFDALMQAKPQLAVQLKKSGTAQQARKKYKLTKAGLDQVKSMIGTDSE